MKVGVHVSVAGSIDQAVDRAAALKCDTFQIFTRNPRGWKFKELDPESAKLFRKKLEDARIGPAVTHMPYLPNLACPKDDIYKISVKALTAELERCDALGIPYAVTHMGSHLGTGLEAGRERVIKAVNTAIADAKSSSMVLLENTAGTANSTGSTFEDVKAILDGIKKQERVGVCFDTCHAFAAGYDLRDKARVQEVLGRFEETIGWDRVKTIHLNDSKGELGCGRDRHEHIGLGCIGEAGFSVFLHDQCVGKIPLILETPIDERRDDVGNLQKVRSLAS